MAVGMAKATAWLAVFVLAFDVTRGAVAKIWQQHQSAYVAGQPLPLHDWSWAGYHYSQKAIPEVNTKIFDVTTYGAKGDGKTSNNGAVQSAINAAEKAGGGVVYFPKGTYMFGTKKNDPTIAAKGAVLLVSTNNIVFRGAGASASGSVLWLAQEQLDIPLIEFSAKSGGGSSKLAVITATALRDSRAIKVDTTVNMEKEQCFRIRYGDTNTYSNKGVKYVQKMYGKGTYLPSVWSKLSTRGVVVFEYHCIERIDKTTRTVYLTEPLKLDFFKHETPFEIWKYKPLTEVGVEDLMFKGSWDKVSSEFCHHCTPTDDWAFTALRGRYVRNFWIRNVEFKDWNQGIRLYQASHGTIRDVTFSGKKGHHSVEVRQSFGVLVMDCKDTAAHHHGPSVSFYDEGTVYLRHEMAAGQSIDFHSENPTNTLFDNIKGGVLSGSGGTLSGYPNHGGNATFWNFMHRGTTTATKKQAYSFWPTAPGDGKKGGMSFRMPRFVGLYNDPVTVDTTTAIVESLGTAVEPSSLFVAQLCLRIGSANCPGGVPTALAKRSTTTANKQENDGSNSAANGLSSTSQTLMMIGGVMVGVAVIAVVVATAYTYSARQKPAKLEPKRFPSTNSSQEPLKMGASTPQFHPGRLTMSSSSNLPDTSVYV